MQQRLCLAHALVHDPQVLLLDEPASGLDPRARVELRELLRELRSLGKTIVISSHILPELEELCTSRRDHRPWPGAGQRPRRRHRRALPRRRRVPRRGRWATTRRSTRPRSMLPSQPGRRVGGAPRRTAQLEFGAARRRRRGRGASWPRAVARRHRVRQLRAGGQRPRGAVPADHRGDPQPRRTSRQPGTAADNDEAPTTEMHA